MQGKRDKSLGLIYRRYPPAFRGGDVRSVLVLPAFLTKTARSRIMVLNSRVQQVIERLRDIDETYVSIFNGHPAGKLNHSTWKLARSRAELTTLLDFAERTMA